MKGRRRHERGEQRVLFMDKHCFTAISDVRIEPSGNITGFVRKDIC